MEVLRRNFASRGCIKILLTKNAKRHYWVDKCDSCLQFKTPNYQQVPLVNISTTQPLEFVCTDFQTLESAKGGVQNKLVITDI